MITPKKKPGRGGLLLLEPLPVVDVAPRGAIERGQKSFALLVGCGQFGASLEPLPGALRDVTALYLRLSNGRCGYQSEDVKVLLNPSGLTFVSELQELVRTLSASHSSYDSLLLYVSTHGYYQDGEYRLCMSDVALAGAEEPEASISFAWLRDTLAPLRSFSQIVILDTCRVSEDQAPPFVSQPNEAPRREDLYLLGESWSILTSSAHGEVAWLEDASHVSGQGGPHSLFARVLLDELDNPGVGQDVLEVVPLHKSLQGRLHELVQEMHPGVTQTPCLIANFQHQPIFARRLAKDSGKGHPSASEISAPKSTSDPGVLVSTQPASPSVGWLLPFLLVVFVCVGLGWLVVQRQASSAVAVGTKPGPRQDAGRPLRPALSIRKSPDTPTPPTTPTQLSVVGRQVVPIPRRKSVVASARISPRKRQRKRRKHRRQRTRRLPPRVADASGAAARLVRKILGRKWDPCHFRWGKALSFGRSCFPIDKMRLLGKVASGRAYVRHFHLSRSSVRDEDLRHLAGFSQTQSLFLDRTQVDGSGLQALRHWRELKVLSLAHTRFSPSSAALLQHFSALTSLKLYNTYIDDRAMGYVGRLTRLQRLSLGDTDVRGRGLLALSRLQHLTHLSICNRSPQQRRQQHYGQHGSGADVPDPILARLPALRSLRSFKLCRTSTSNKGIRSFLRRIRDFPNLRVMTLQATRISQKAAQALRREYKSAGIRLHFSALR